MAKCTPRTEKVQVTTYEDKRVGVTLELTEEEARILHTITGQYCSCLTLLYDELSKVYGSTTDPNLVRRHPSTLVLMQ